MGRRTRKKNKIIWVHENEFDPMDHAPHCPQFLPVEHNRDFIQQLKKDWDFKEYCAICEFPLTYDYPKDYPKEWMFCCSCFRWARAIVTSKEDYVKEALEKGLEINNTIAKIYRKITLVKGNGN